MCCKKKIKQNPQRLLRWLSASFGGGEGDLVGDRAAEVEGRLEVKFKLEERPGRVKSRAIVSLNQNWPASKV